MLDIHDQVRRMAPSQAPVFITGESGTGKELCAAAVHELSDRNSGRFVTLNCAAIPRDLIESEIFGYVRGAFTGAADNRAGAAEQADGGTLFLDEIGEMDLLLQSKLLRFLQTGTFQRLGDTASRKVDARIICATNRDPLTEITAGRFREDLYYRLHVLPVHLPALRERREDILPLAEAFLKRYSGEERRNFRGFDADAEARIVSYGWPGNVRQLENTIRQIVVMNDGAAVTHEMLPLVIRDAQSRPNGIIDLSRERSRAAPASRPFGAIEPLWAQERRIIEDALDAFDGNIAMAAAALEISPSTIYRKNNPGPPAAFNRLYLPQRTHFLVSWRRSVYIGKIAKKRQDLRAAGIYMTKQASRFKLGRNSTTLALVFGIFAAVGSAVAQSPDYKSPSPAFTEALAAFDAAWTADGLAFSTVTFTDGPGSGYGKYTATENNVFSAGDTIALYAEPVGYAFDQSQDGYTYKLSRKLPPDQPIRSGLERTI
jgi:transcriptional regulator with AAA-type ATPase domain